MNFILNLSGWKFLTESENQNTKIFFHFRKPISKYQFLSFMDLRSALFKRVQKIYPDATYAAAKRVITIPNRELPEEVEQPPNFILDLDKTSVSTEPEQRMPDLLMDTMYEFSTNSSYPKYSENGVFWIEVKPEYSNLSADDFKKLITDTIKKKYEILDFDSFAEDLKLHFSMEIVGGTYGLYGENEVKQFMDTLVRNEEVMYSLEQIEKTEIQRTVFDIKKVKADFGLKKKELMVDYSGFTSEKLDSVSDSILNYLSYLGNLLGTSGPKMNYLIEPDMVDLLLHFKKYPELWQKLEARSSS